MGLNAKKRFILKMSVIPSYMYSGIPKVLNEYVFMIETIYSDDEYNGFTTIDIVQIHTLDIFDTTMKFQYKGGNLGINEFVDIVESESEYGKDYVAILKNQLSQNKQYLYDKSILLCSDNGGGSKQLNNIPIAQLGHNFESKIKHYKEEEKLNRLAIIKRYIHRKQENLRNEEYKADLSKIMELIEFDYEIQKDKIQESFDRYLKTIK